MDRRAAIIRNIRRQWSPHRVWSQIYQDRVSADDPSQQRSTVVEVLDRYYFLLTDPAAVQQATTYANTHFPAAPNYESYRLYRLYRDLENVDELGQRIWDGTTLFVSGWAVTSPFYAETVGTPPPVFDESYVLTRTGATLNARYSLTNASLGAVYPGRPPYVGHDLVTLATVETATGGWEGATDLRISPSDRFDREDGEFVLYVWRGWGGERFQYPVGASAVSSTGLPAF
jgi:hypothetical protein